MNNSICIFGDSVAKGVIYDAAKNKYILLKDSFSNLIQNNLHFSVTNHAKFGSTILSGDTKLTRHIQDLASFDYTLLEFGGNDCDYDWEQISISPEKSHFAKTTLDHFRDAYSKMILKIKENGGRPILMNLPPISPELYFNWISRGLNEQNILFFLGEKSKIFSWQESYSNAVMDLAATFHVPLIDIRSAFLEKLNFQDYLCVDGIHPNKKGHLLISGAIEKQAYLFQ